MALRSLLIISCFLICTLARAQEAEPKPRLANHYLGVQVNELLHQLLNLGNAAPVNNPYMFVYSVNSAKNGWGLNVGFGYTMQETFQQTFPTRRTTTDNLFYRVGIERKNWLGKKWMVSYGLDYVIEDLTTKTEVNSTPVFPGPPPVPPPTNTIITTETKSSVSGAGLRLGLNFAISERVLIGTEATYYYKNADESTKTTGAVTNPPEVKNNLTTFVFAVPAVLFVFIKI